MVKFKKDTLYFIPLGGAGHFGANLNVYVYNDQYLLVDLGMGFPDDLYPGLEVILPDIRFLEGKEDKIVGLVITHAHEDHIGGIHHLWHQLKCPIYATPFTKDIIQQKFDWKYKKKDKKPSVPFVEIVDTNPVQIGDFSVQPVGIPHSVPEHYGMVIRVPNYGPVLHTGDWTFDDTPVMGERADFEMLDQLKKEGVFVAIGDSTNVMKPGRSPSEADAYATFMEAFKRFKNRIVVTCFSSNVSRVKSIILAADACGRKPVLVGMSLWRMYEAAKDAGYLKNMPKVLKMQEAQDLPKDKVLLICTGSQGEPRSAVTRIAYDDHREVTLDKGDSIIYSSWSIPGNEKAIVKVKTRFLKKGIEVVDDLPEGVVHASGHGHRDEVAEMYERTRPDIVIPVHGEVQMLYAHARLAEETGVKQTVIPENGTVIELDAKTKTAKIVDQIEINPLSIDGTHIVDQDSEHVINRRRLTYAGSATVTVVVDETGTLIARPVITSWGLIDGHPDEDAIYDELSDYVAEEFSANTNPQSMEESARWAVRRFFNNLVGKKPMTKTHLIEV